MGVAALITYVTLGRRRIDYRFVLLGAVLPDVVDALLAVWAGPAGGDRYVAHSLLAPCLVAAVVVLVARGERRLALFGLAVGWLLHLVTDGMWQRPQTFLWPAFGTDFPAVSDEPYSWDLLMHPLAHLGTWLAELAGGLALLWFWSAFRLGDRDRRRLWLRDGQLRA
jgi:hypothetical protein